MAKSTKSRKKLYSTNSSKMLVAGVIAASAVAGITVIGDTNEVEASSTLLSSKSPGDIITVAGIEFYVVSTEITGVKLMAVDGIERAFDTRGSNRFDPTNSNNIAYYLNNTYYNNLPSELREVMIENQTWYIGSIYNEMSDSVVANVGMLTRMEFESVLFSGVIPHLFAKYEFGITPHISSVIIRYHNATGLILAEQHGTTVELWTRPVIYLKSDLEVLPDGTVITNTPPIITVFNKTKVFDVVDNSTNATFTIEATDREQTNLTATVQYNNEIKATANLSETNEIQLSGSNYSNGLYDSPIVATVNDGIENSSPGSIEGHIIIKVDDAADYLADLNGHTNNAETYTKTQHQSFLTAYEAVRTYETGRTQIQYDTAKQGIADLISATEGVKTATTDEWKERLAVVFATVALEGAESSFVLADYEALQPLYDGLSQVNKNILKARYDELTKYHAGNTLMLQMEAEVNRHKANANTELDTRIINTSGFNDIKVAIAVLQNDTPTLSNSYKTDLNKRLNELRSYYLQHKDVLSPEDLAENLSNVNHSLGGMYDDYRNIFVPISQETIDYVNTIATFMEDVTQTTYDAYQNYLGVLSTTDTVVDMSKIAKVTAVIDAIYDYRTTFRNDDNKLDNITQLIGAIDLKLAADGSTVSQNLFTQINSVLKEVTEYTDIPLFDEHDENEKNEAIAAVDVLVTGQFKTDMASYLNNGIPQIIFIDNPYEYIVDGALTVKGTFTDDNDKHDITVTFDGTAKTLNNVTTKSFETQFTGLTEGAYIGKELSVVVNDGLASKGVQITSKPVISVSNPNLFTDMVKALEADKNTTLSVMTEPTITELLNVFNKMIIADRNISPTNLSALYAQARSLSGVNNGELVNYVRDYVQANLLQSIYDDHETATVGDFTLAGVEKDGLAVVTTEIIEDLKALITEYKNSDLAAQTPTIDDYINWAEMLSGSEGLNDLFESIYVSNDVKEVETLITNVQIEVNKIPSWSTLITKYNSKIEEITDYKNALKSVISSEIMYVQADIDLSGTLVMLVDHAAANSKLTNRLVKAQSLVDAESALVQAETSLDEMDISNAKSLILALEADTEITTGVHAVKLDDLKIRLGVIDKITAAQDAVQKAEDTFATGNLEQAQLSKDVSQSLLRDLPSSQVKDGLQVRLDVLQKAINVAVAEKTVEEAEESLTQEGKDKAQELVNELTEGSKKDELKVRLEGLQNAIDKKTAEEIATSTMQKAEESWLQIDLDAAQILSEQLAEGTVKEDLTQRLVILQNLIKQYELAKNAVEKAEVSKLDSDANTAQMLIDALPVSTQKTELQEPLNELSRYILAEAAVTKAETAKYERYLEQAQSLVNQLKDGPDKNTIQTRLDTLKLDLDGKENDIIDRIVNGNLRITAEELADYTKETVFVEQLDEYIANMREVADQNGILTKEDVIEVIRVLKALEIAKRQMTDATISAYQTVLEKVSISIKGKYPTPQVMFATAAYLADDSKQIDFAQAIANLLSRDLADVQAEIDSILAVRDNGTYTIQYVDEEGTVIISKTHESKFGQVFVSLEAPKGYVLTDATEFEFELNKETNAKVFDKTVKKVEGELTEPETGKAEQITPYTIGEETALVRSLLVASLNDVTFMTSRIATVSHEQYLYKAAQALVMVKAYTINPTQSNLDTAKDYVAGNFYDGTYKMYLLSLLGIDIKDTGDDGEVDLTPVSPYVPPAVNPTLPGIGFEVPKELQDKGSIAVKEKIEAEKSVDESYKWSIQNPLNTEFTLIGDGMEIRISFDKKVIDKALKIEVHWKHLGDENYQLIIHADGKEIQSFTASIKLSKDFAYMLRQVGGQYNAIPYNYTQGKFNFAVTSTGVFYFTKDKLTFDDITEFTEMKAAIEELASRHIVYGVTSSKYAYAPNGTVTRAQFATMLTRALGLKASDSHTPFKDTTGGWYEKEVQALYEAGIISGTSATTFSPDSHLTREHAAMMLYKVLAIAEDNDVLSTSSGKLPAVKTATFKDQAKIASDAKIAVATLQSLGLIQGYSGEFKPQDTLIRAHLAKILAGALRLTGNM